LHFESLFLHRAQPQYRSTTLGFTVFKNLCLLNHRRHYRGTLKFRFASHIETLNLLRFARFIAQRTTSENAVL
jgi:hypothetical protein